MDWIKLEKKRLLTSQEYKDRKRKTIELFEDLYDDPGFIAGVAVTPQAQEKERRFLFGDGEEQ